MQNIDQHLRAFVNETFLFGQGADALGGDDSLMEQGIIDSTGVLEIVTFIEQQYGIRLADDELMPENLDSLNRLSRFVTRKLAERPEGMAACC